MASTFNSPDVTSNSAPKAIHAGVNAVQVQYTLDQTASGAYTLNMYPLPGGARVFDVKVGYTSPIEAGANTNGLVTVKDSEGNVYIQSASAANSVVLTYNPLVSGLASQLSASANLQIGLTGFGGTGTASTTFTVTLLYTTDEDSGN